MQTEAPVMSLEECKRNVNRAKLTLMTIPNTMFFSALLATLRLVYTTRVPTAAVDGVCLYLNPEFVAKQTVNKLIGLLLHEVLHIAYEHLDRKKAMDLDHERWNIAGDYYINPIILSRGFELPEGGLYEASYVGLSTLQIYNELDDTTLPSNFNMDIIMPTDGTGSVDPEEITSNIVKAVTQARLSNEHGSIPGELLRRLDDVLNPKLPWNNILMNYMSAYAKDDYTWSKFNKRFWPSWYLPGMQSEALNQITVAVDVSGSVSNEDLSEFMAEIRYIWDYLKPKSMRLMGFDTKIHDDLEFNEGDSVADISLNGGGGTYVEPVISTVVEDMPEITIIFTDGQFGMPDMSKLATDLFWIIKGNPDFSPGAGEVIHFES